MIKKPSVVQAGGHFSNLAVLTHFIPQASFCTPWKHQKSKGFSMFSRCIETTGMKWVKKKEIKEKKNNILQTFATLPHFSSKQSCSFNLSFGNGVKWSSHPWQITSKIPRSILCWNIFCTNSNRSTLQKSANDFSIGISHTDNSFKKPKELSGTDWV